MHGSSERDCSPGAVAEKVPLSSGCIAMPTAVKTDAFFAPAACLADVCPSQKAFFGQEGQNFFQSKLISASTCSGGSASGSARIEYCSRKRNGLQVRYAPEASRVFSGGLPEWCELEPLHFESALTPHMVRRAAKRRGFWR
ncbi:MAG: hypothetical protein U0M13_01175, partial [Desulfovibrio fairfieldensis]|nr:hypothetical protein [Desulfovibrio fairfieldensis]